jgi:hypothetical protein
VDAAPAGPVGPVTVDAAPFAPVGPVDPVAPPVALTHAETPPVTPRTWPLDPGRTPDGLMSFLTVRVAPPASTRLLVAEA